MLTATESRLGAIAAGTTTPFAGLRALNADLADIVKKSGFAANASRKVTIVCVVGKREISISGANNVEPKCPPGTTKK